MRPFSITPSDPRRAQAFTDRLNRPMFLERTVVTPLSDTYLAGRGMFGIMGTDSLGGVAPFYVANQRTQTPFTSTAFSANVAKAVPFLCDNGHRVSGLSFYLAATGAGSSARVALYDSKDDRAGNLYPNARLWESGAIATSAGSGWASLPANLTLTPGRMYWIVYVNSATVPTLYSVPLASCDHLLGADVTHLSVSYTFAELPLRFPTGATVATVAPPALAIYFSNPASGSTVRTIPCYTTPNEGLSIRRATIMRGSTLNKTPSDKPYVTIDCSLRRGTRASVLGTFDSRDLALTQGSPITLFDGTEDMPEGGTLEAVITQFGWPHVSLADTAIQWDLSYKGA